MTPSVSRSDRLRRGGILKLSDCGGRVQARAVSSVLRKAVIPAAGMGTRLLSVTKEQPKEMLPVFARAMNGDLCLKPIVQLIFEQLYSVGFRDFCFIVGRGKRAIEDHFTPDLSFISKLDSKGLDGATEELDRKSTRLNSSH